jgi:type II secretory pathway pseudopilin PulG
MAVKLNLLPSDYSLAGPVRQLLKLVRPLNVVLLSLFVVVVLGMGGFFIFSSLSLQSLTSSNNNLKNQIQTQESAQQQIVLLKDRLSKIKTVEVIPNANKNLSGIDPFLTSLSGGSLISDLDVEPQKTSTSIVFKTNSDLTNFIKSLDSNSVFSTITLGTFSYNVTGGYLVGLDFAGK